MDEEPQDPALQRRRLTLQVIGVVLIVLGTLNLTVAGYGTEVRRDFAQRRSYDMIKPRVQAALPRTAVLGLGGLCLILYAAGLGRTRD